MAEVEEAEDEAEALAPPPPAMLALPASGVASAASSLSPVGELGGTAAGGFAEGGPLVGDAPSLSVALGEGASM